jgi:excisionase family DNA binding protein
VEDRLLYRVTEVAVFLNVSRSKVYELLASGALRSVKIDRTRFGPRRRRSSRDLHLAVIALGRPYRRTRTRPHVRKPIRWC